MPNISFTNIATIGDAPLMAEIQTFQANQNVMSIQFHKTGITVAPGQTKTVNIPEHLCAVLKFIEPDEGAE